MGYLAKFLLAAIFIGLLLRKCTSQFGTPPLCLLNRLDEIPCRFQGNTAMPGDNEYGIYSTRIRNGPICRIRRRNHVVRPIDTIGGDPRILYIFSPGRALANPRRYGNQQLVQYRITCPPNHIAFFNLTSIDMQGAGCTDSNFNQPRCTDYIQVSRRGGAFGFTEACGNVIPSDLTTQLDSGTIDIEFRTSDRRRFPGFTATVTCVNINLIQTDDSSNTANNLIQQFNARVRRQVDYVKRMRRSTLSDIRSLACSLDEINVPFNAGIIYENRAVTIIDIPTMRVIQRLPAPINRLTTLDNDGSQQEFFREAPQTNDSTTIFPGPGPLTRAGVFVFFTTFATIPELGNIPPEMIIPTQRESSVTGELLSAHFDQPLEGDDEILADEDLEPPPFDPEEFGLNATSTDGDNLLDASLTQSFTNRRTKRVVEMIEPVQCNYTNQTLSTAILNQAATNPVLATVVDVIMNCTEREQPGRITELIESIAIDFRFSQDIYTVSEDAGNLTVCIEIETEGFLPRDIEMNLVTQNGNATEPNDYTFVNATSTFFNGTSQDGPGSQMCIQIEIFSDTLVEFDEVFLVTADSPDPNVNTTLITATVIILDDDVMFELDQFPASYAVSEDSAATLQITVNHVRGILPFDVTVTFRDEGTANVDEDFAVSTIDLSFMSGSQPGASQSAMLSVNEDDLVESSTESIILHVVTIPASRLAISSAQDSVLGTITDNDVPVFRLIENQFFVIENDTTLSITVELTQRTLTFPIDIMVRDVTQSMGISNDYVDFDTSLIFPVGSGPGTRLSFNVTIIDDDVFESDEVIMIEVTVSVPGEFPSGGTSDSVTILLLDNDVDEVVCPDLPSPENGQVTFSASSQPPYPLGTVATYTCLVGFGLFEGNDVRVCNSTGLWSGEAPTCVAAFCSDLPNPENGQVSFLTSEPAPFLSGTVAVYTCDVGFAAVDGDIYRFCNSSGLWSGSALTCVAITFSVFRFSQDIYLVREDAGNLTVCVDSEIEAVGSLSSNIELNILTQNGNATEPSDYTSVNDSFFLAFQLTLQALAGSEACIEIDIHDDLLIEFDEVFQVTAVFPNPNINATLITATVIILDDDVTFELRSLNPDLPPNPDQLPGADTFIVEEGIRLSVLPFAFGLTSGVLPPSFNVSIVLLDNGQGTATAGQDYFVDSFNTTDQQGTLIIQLFLVVIDDETVEDETERANLSFSSIPIARLAFPPEIGPIDLTIVDNDIPFFNITQNEFFLEESNTTLSITFELTQGFLDIPIDIQIFDFSLTDFDFSSSSGSASGPGSGSGAGVDPTAAFDSVLSTSDEDYEDFMTNLTFPAGSVPGDQLSLDINILDDDIFETDEVILIVAIISSRGEFISDGFAPNISVFAILTLDNDGPDHRPLSMLYPFGPDEGDLVLERTVDDSSGQIDLQYGAFQLFGVNHTSLFVNNNGIISTIAPFTDFEPQTFPFPTPGPIIAPFWADVDTNLPASGNVFYRETRDPAVLQRARDEIQAGFSFFNLTDFDPTLAFIATWLSVGYFERGLDLRNTFQCVIVADAQNVFVIFLYNDIQWTQSTLPNVNPAHAGINAGDGALSISVPGSLTDEIINITMTSNVGRPGVWMFPLLLDGQSPGGESPDGGGTDSILYPLNFDNELVLAGNDNSAGPITLQSEFQFVGANYDTIYVNNNGLISLDFPFPDFNPEIFPFSSQPIIAPFWADVDTTPPSPGTVLYGVTQNVDLLQRARDDILSGFSAADFDLTPFNPTQLFVTTWFRVGYFGQVTDQDIPLENTFQCVLASDSQFSFIIFLYEDIQWTTGDRSDGVDGLGGNPAHAGINVGDGQNAFSIDRSSTDDILNITMTSNVGRPGVWMFRVDRLFVESP